MSINDNELVSLDTWQTVEDPLAEAVGLADSILDACTGHDDYQRKKIAYYALATHFLKVFDPFPILVIYGPPSTGKSETLAILGRLCHKAISASGEGLTEAAFRSTMAEAHECTLIIEEGEKISAPGMEEELILRFERATAKIGKMVRDGDEWRLEIFKIYGATILHRRNLFRSAALLRRAIPIRTKRIEKEYSEIADHEELFRQFHDKLEALPNLPKLINVWGIEGGIFRCFRPLLALALYLNDTDFANKLLDETGRATRELKEEESYLEAPVILKALIGLTYEHVRKKFTLDRIGIEAREINPYIREEFGANHPVLMLSANQRNRIIREDLGFIVKGSHGRSKVFLTVPGLVKAADDWGVSDEVIDEWRKLINESTE